MGHAIAISDGSAHDAETQPAMLGMADLTSRLAGHVKRIDHTGVNLPASATSSEQWRNLVSAIASASTMYRYPTGEEWQFALWTDLTRAELELMFPEPEGITLPGLEEIFRVVRTYHPWPGPGIRFDLCYRIENSPSDWETGEWLVTQGGRIR